MTYYHYSKGCHLGKIVGDGIIKTSRLLIEKRERPAVWLTKSPEWEKACNVGIVLNSDELTSGEYYSSSDIHSITVDNEYMRKNIGMCRILVSDSVSVVSWAKFRYVSKISEGKYQALDSYSRSIGCQLGQWICSFNSIPQKYWEGIEMYVVDKWVRWDGKISIEEFYELCMSCNND